MYTKRFVPVVDWERGLGQSTAYGLYRWEDAYFVPHVIEINLPDYMLRIQRSIVIGQTLGVWVQENFFIPPEALCTTDQSAWERVYDWIDLMEESILNAAQ